MLAGGVSIRRTTALSVGGCVVCKPGIAGGVCHSVAAGAVAMASLPVQDVAADAGWPV